MVFAAISRSFALVVVNGPLLHVALVPEEATAPSKGLVALTPLYSDTRISGLAGDALNVISTLLLSAFAAKSE